MTRMGFMRFHAVGVLSVLLAATSANGQVESIPLATIGPGPAMGRLPVGVTPPDGVGWSVNVGTWIPPQGYTIQTSQSPQTWTFSRTVSLRFGIAGLNLANEGFVLPVGVVAEFIHPNHQWNPATRTIQIGVSSTAAESIFTIASVDDLVLQKVGSGGAGPTFIEVTVDGTPSLDKSFSWSSGDIGGVVQVIFTITNSDDLFEKPGWSFTDDLPAGLEVADPPNESTDCTNPVVTAPGGGTSIEVSGDLASGQAGCTVTVDVTTLTPGVYVNRPDNVTSASGIEPPTESATVQFTNCQGGVADGPSGPGAVDRLPGDPDCDDGGICPDIDVNDCDEFFNSVRFGLPTPLPDQ
jgi:hypothetical protein